MMGLNMTASSNKVLQSLNEWPIYKSIAQSNYIVPNVDMTPFPNNLQKLS